MWLETNANRSGFKTAKVRLEPDATNGFETASRHAVRGAACAPAPIAVALALSACLHAAQPAMTPAFDGGRAYEHLRQIVSIGPRPAGSQGAELTRLYITQHLSIIGLTAEEQPFVAQTPLGAVRMTNLRATIPGPGTGRLVIGGHYDTKLFREFTFVGANDGGSSTAFLLELARLLKARPNAMTIELLFLDGEESTGDWTGNDHTYGSQYYVDTARKSGTLKDLRAFILVDMIGDRDLVMKRESRSTPWLTNAIWSAAKRLKRAEFSDESTPIDDDHIPFLEAGVPAVDLIDLDYAHWHAPGDTLDKVSARSLEVVGEVLLAALPEIEERLRR
jgi:glutaminyl-peptide cyclotransferase